MANCVGRCALPVTGLLGATQCCRRRLSGLARGAFSAGSHASRVLTAESVPHAYVAPTGFKPSYRAVLVDAAGTFLIPSESVSDVYLRYARRYGCAMDGHEVLQRFRRAYNTPWRVSTLRYVGDARPFWRFIVEESTGCSHPEVSEAIYEYYERPEAWRLMPGVVEALQRLKSAGVLLAVVSNFDTRLRPLLARLGVEDLFDAVIVSAEVLAEKPNPVIFDAAVRALSATAVTRGTLPLASGSGGALASAAAPYAGSYCSGAASFSSVSDFGPLVSGYQLHGPHAQDFAPLSPEQVVHVGDDRRNDCWGARSAGLVAWHWGYDVRSWAEVADRVLHGSQADDYYDDLRYEACS